jgi:hypothetical protein
MPQRIHVASPCPADWQKMSGDERVRFCPECNLNVYNFSAMTAAEVERIVSRTEGRLCARFYQRADGTVLTKNCPVGFRAALWRGTRVASATLAAVLSMRPALGQSTPSAKQQLTQIENAQRGLSLKVADPTGAAIPGASVTITNETTGAETRLTSSSDGKIDLPDLPRGLYTIVVQVRGFEAATQPHVTVPTIETVQITVVVAPLMGEVVTIQRNPVARLFHKIRDII